MFLSTQTNKISGVVNFPKDLTAPSDIDNFILKFKSFCEGYSKEYYLIFHNRDINYNSGEFKTPHIHFLIDTTAISDRKRLSTHLNNIALALNVDTVAISIEVWKLYENAIQYLIHKNDKEKVAYKSSEIITNQTPQYLKLILDREIDTNITIEYLIELIQTSKNRVEVYSKLGLGNSKKFRNIINDLYNDFHNQR